MDDLELVSQTTTTATAYSFRFKWGWAIFTLNDRTGELSIHSDWGTYGHRWHIGSLGERHTLHTFLAQCDGDYVTRKLLLDTRSECLKDVICEETSLKELRRHICESRRKGLVEKQYARDMLDLAERWCKSDDFPGECPRELAEFLDWEEHEWIIRKKSARFVFMRDKLWPFFTAWLRENVVNKQATAANV